MTRNLYKCYHEFDKDDYLEWHIYETATDQVIAKFIFEDDALEYMENLERGMGFNGFTPSFMLTRIPIDINSAFAAEFS